MKKMITGMLFMSLPVLVNADIKPYAGLTVDRFAISAEDATMSDGAGFSATLDKSKDRGTAFGFGGGLIIGDNAKIDLNYFSGKDRDSEIFNVKTSTLTYEYSFNNLGFQRGWFIGGGIASIEIEVDAMLVLGSAGFGASEEKATGAILTGGYEYLFDNNIALELGINAYAFDVDLKMNVEGSYLGADLSELEVELPASLSSFYLQMNYVF